MDSIFPFAPSTPTGSRGEPYDWMPQLYSGFYLTGEGQAGVYHPLHQLLYRILPLHAALGCEYLLSYPLMMLGTWLLLRRRLGRNDAAALGGLLFAFSSFNLLHFVHPNAVAVIAHIPWLLWAIDIVLVDSRHRKVTWATALIALLTGSQLLLGYPQYVWFSLLAETSYAIFLAATQRYAARGCCDLHVTCDECVGCATSTWPRIVIAKGIGLLLGGMQLLPSLDAWLHSGRTSVDASFAAWGSLAPSNLLQLVGPYVLADRAVGGNTHEFGMYLGAAPLVLCAWAIVRRRELGTLKPLARASLAFAMVALLLAFGEYGGLQVITSRLPLVRSLRFPCRYLVLFQLAAAVLASIGFAALVDESRRERKLRLGDPCGAEPGDRPALWRDFEPFWCLVGVSLAVAITAACCHRDVYTSSWTAAAVGPVSAGDGRRAADSGGARLPARAGRTDSPGRARLGIIRRKLRRLFAQRHVTRLCGIGSDSARRRWPCARFAAPFR